MCQGFDGPVFLLLSWRCWVERGYDDGSPGYHDSAVSPCSMAVQLSSTSISHHDLLSHISSIRLCSQQQHSPLDCSTVPKLQLAATAPFRQPASLSWVCRAVDCLILIPFRLPQISCFTLSLKCFTSDSDNCPNVGIRPRLQFPHLPREVQSY